MKRIKEPKLKKLAKECCPYIFHQISKGSNYLIDFPTEIYTTKFDPIKNGLPAIYYNGWEHEGYYYLMYAFFHRIDKNHDFDFEGFCIKVNSDSIIGLPDYEVRKIGIITVSHFMFLHSNSGRNLTIGSGSHAIKPNYERSPIITEYSMDAFKFIPMHGKKWDRTVKGTTPHFKKHGVKFPNQWNSRDGKYRIAQWCKRHVKDECNGMIWRDSQLLFKIIEQWSTSKRGLIPEIKEYLKG